MLQSSSSPYLLHTRPPKALCYCRDCGVFDAVVLRACSRSSSPPCMSRDFFAAASRAAFREQDACDAGRRSATKSVCYTIKLLKLKQYYWRTGGAAAMVTGGDTPLSDFCLSCVNDEQRGCKCSSTGFELLYRPAQ